MPSSSKQALERKRAHDREYRRAQREEMSPEARADARREHDRAYRQSHRSQRQEADRARNRRLTEARWASKSQQVS